MTMYIFFYIYQLQLNFINNLIHILEIYLLYNN